MTFDFKKEYKEFYLPPKTPHLIEIPSMNYLAVRGHGDPNLEGGEYKASIGLLYVRGFACAADGEVADGDYGYVELDFFEYVPVKKFIAHKCSCSVEFGAGQQYNFRQYAVVFHQFI